MKHIDQIYKEWSGESHNTNDCHPVHDSSEAIDFAEYYHKEMKEKPVVMYGIVSTQGKVDLYSLRLTKRECIEYFIEGSAFTWEQIKKFGWKCVKLDVLISKHSKAL